MKTNGDTMRYLKETSEKIERKEASKQRSLKRGSQRGIKQNLGYKLMQGE